MKHLNTIWRWRPLPHILFWGASFYFIGSYFSISGKVDLIDFIYSTSFHLCLVPLVYINLALLIPKFLQSGRYLLHALGLFLNVIAAYFLHEAVFNILIPSVLTEFYIVSFVDAYSLTLIFISYLGLTSLLKFSKSWFKIQQLEKEKIQFELHSLKSQLNPHFLFNGLNSIYSLSLQKSEFAPQAVLKLSELLRYSLYESNQEKVSLEREVENLQHYVDLQKLRVRDDSNIDLTILGDISKFEITPMILLPMVENIFKHGDLESDRATDL